MSAPIALRQIPRRTSHASVWHATMRDSRRWHSVHAAECHQRLRAIMRSHARGACKVQVDGRASHSWRLTSGGTRVMQAEPVGRRRRADHAGLVQHDGLARPRAARLTGRRLQLRRGLGLQAYFPKSPGNFGQHFLEICHANPLRSGVDLHHIHMERPPQRLFFRKNVKIAKSTLFAVE
jgi:hypothetical protein